VRFCPECKAQYSSGEKRCPKDDAPLLTLPEKDEVPLERAGLQRLQPVEADNSRYTIISKIGQGGWGGIYRAYQHSTRREVALKVLRHEVAHDDVVRRRFHREAEAVSRLKHPNTVTTFDFGETPEGLLFIAMEYIEGVSLDEVIENEEKLPTARAVRIARQIALSLAEAHEKGIVHRDVKPHNIMLTSFDGREDFVKVLDFGVAKLMAVDSDLTTTGATFGTPEYMSPEQVQSKDIDQRSDLYALGVILYQMLTGAPPFTGNSAVTVALSHVRQRPPAIRDRSDVPRPLLGLVKRLLAKDPRDRPQSAGELAAELEQVEGKMVAWEGRHETSRMFRNMAGAMTSGWLTPVTLLVVVVAVILAVVLLRSKLPGGGTEPLADVVGEGPGTRPALTLVAPDVPVKVAVDVVGEGAMKEPDVITLDDVVSSADGGGADVVESRDSRVADPELMMALDSASAPLVAVSATKVDVVVLSHEAGSVESVQDVTVAPSVVTQQVTANIDGADVTVAGRTICETPCVLEGVPGHKRKIRVLKKGYLTAKRRFTFALGAQPLYIELQKVSLSKEDGLKGAPTPAEEDGLK
jgi:tRNA A-37 threonylcarbamoyl transferase component Bud32